MSVDSSGILVSRCTRFFPRADVRGLQGRPLREDIRANDPYTDLYAYRFPSKEGPQFKKGTVVNLAFQCAGLVIVLAMSAWYRMENKRRDKVEGGRPPKGTALNVIEEHDLATGMSWMRLICG